MIALIAVAWADPCAALDDGMPEGPASVGVRPGELGRAHRVCGRSEVAVGGGALLLADAPAFYGHIVGTAELDASALVAPTTELFARIEAFRYDTVLAPLPDTFTGPGWLSVGLAQRVVTGERVAVGLNGKVLAPAHYGRAFPVGADLGVALTWAPSGAVRVHGQLSGALESNVGAGPGLTRAGFSPTAGVALRAGKAFAFGLDALASFGLTAPVDHVALAPSFRFAAGERFGAELSLAAPLAGRERALVFADLRVSVRI